MQLMPLWLQKRVRALTLSSALGNGKHWANLAFGLPLTMVSYMETSMSEDLEPWSAPKSRSQISCTEPRALVV